MILIYWRRVIAKAVVWGVGLATGGPKRLIRGIVVAFAALGVLYYFSGATESGKQLDETLRWLMALGLACLFFIALGLFIVPPQIDKMLREEKEALSAQIDARGSTRELFNALSDQWESGKQVYESRGPLKAGVWRGDVWAWHSRTIAVLSDVKEPVASQSLQGWQSHEKLKQTGNPGQGLLLQFNESLKVIANERDRLSRLIAEESNLGVFAKDDVPSA